MQAWAYAVSDVQRAEQTPEQPTSGDVAEQNASRSDDALDAILKREGVKLPDDESNTAPSRGADGRFVKKQPPEPEKAEKSEPVEPKNDPEPSPKYSDEDIRKAVAAAQRYKAPKSVLKAIEQGDEDAIAYGLNVAKIQADADDFTKKYKTLQQELESLKSRPAANSGDDGKGKQAPTESRPEIDKLADYLADMLGDEEAKRVVRDSLAGLTKPTENPELEAVKQQNAALQKQVEALAMERARDALVSEYSDLKDKDTWAKVKERAETLAASYPDLYERLEASARIELAPELIRRARAEKERRDRLRDNGAPSAPSRANYAEGRLTLAQLQDEMLDAKMKGDNQRYQEARAALHARIQT